ncbi:sperm-associated antigen 5 [Myxocyprinus asiaticus]|uniref:sperm-associated antigen 5 n=1 Tax=Myxocyprinus asiaticus TaxID=70543 RepID=UPI002223D63A|nr:sperm-associated antigen 5 [Myxocyprinus asiaticus]
MSSTRGLSNHRADRSPFRDVQNELLNLQDNPTLMLKHASKLERVPKMKREDVSGETPSYFMKCCDVQTLSSTTDVCSDAQTGNATDEHQDVILKSFVCLEGEVIVEDEPVKSNESVLIKHLTMENNHPPQRDANETDEAEDIEDNQTSEQHVDHPYSCGSRSTGSDFSSTLYQREEVSTCELGSVTFKSLMCSGVEIEISDSSAIADGSTLTNDQGSGNHSQCLVSNTPVSKTYTDALSVDHQPMDHSYCNWKSRLSLSGDDTTISTADAMLDTSETANEHIVSTHSELKNTANLNNYGHADPSEKSRQEEITFKSLCCSGIEIDIGDLSKVSETSVFMENLAEEQSRPCLNDISEDGPSIAALTSGSEHVDHLYCHVKENVDLLMKSQVLNMPGTEHELCTNSQLLSASLKWNMESYDGNISKKMSESVMCSQMEMEASKMIGSQQPSQCLLASNHGENTLKSSDIVQLSDRIDQPDSDEKPKVLDDDFFVMTEKDIKEHVAHHQPLPENKEALPRAEENPVLSCSRGAFAENVVPDTSILPIDKPHSDAKHTVPNNDSFVMTEKIMGDHVDHHLSMPESKEAFSHAEHNHILSGPHGAFSKNVGQETSVHKDNALGLKGEIIHPEIEVMRLCDRSGETRSAHQGLPDVIALTGPCTPKTSTLSRGVLHDVSTENPLSHLWPELPESPMPPPLFNSTSLVNAFSYTPVPADPPQKKDKEPKVVLNDPPVVGNGPLQEQLRQMAELLMLASGKMLVPTPAPVKHHNALVGTSPVEKHSACVWTTPVQWTDRSINTSAAMEILKVVDVSDASTSTDSLLWNLTPGNLEHLSRSELEQRLTSTLIMVEVLSQQLTSARAHHQSKDTSPSDLRDKPIQTDHTELNQNGTYRDLYVTAQERIQSLEHDQETLRSLHDSIQAMRVGMNSVKTCTEDAIFTIKQIGDIVNVDQETLCTQVCQMKSLYGRYRETLQRMEQKMKGMRQQMDKSLQEKEAAFSVTQQLREYHAAQVAELEHSVGSHKELMSALTLAYPSLVELSKSYMESFSAANVLLRRKHEDHVSLTEELRKSQVLVQRINPVLHQLHQKATAAMEQSNQHLTMRDRAVQERDQMESELEQTRSSLQDASQQITDLNMQQTILTSEMSVLREQLNEAEEERSHLQRRSTELSATVTSTLASYAFLEQTLASENSKLQQSMHDTQQATERANCLEAALEMSRKQIEEYEEALSQRETLIKELHSEAEIHRRQLGQLAQLQTELSSAREMSEFLQAEHEMAREQMEESERLLRCHLQGLRERNLECEDLKLALEQQRLEKDSLQEELESTQEKARSMLLEQGEQLAQASNNVMLLHHRVCCLTSILKESLTTKKSESSDTTLQSLRHPSSSFVDSIMVAMMKKQDPEMEPPMGSEEKEMQHDSIGSESSAFTRIPPTTHTEVKEEKESCVLKLLSDLGETISDLQNTINQLRILKDSEHQTLQQTICDLQEALQTESQAHLLEVLELRQNVDRLQARVEKDAVVLQQKSQEEKRLRKLCSELEENTEATHKYRAENSELRREVADLRRMEQQARVEAQVLREELKQTGVQSAASTSALDERIKLLREVEKLKANLMETEENRAKVLERAKRHQRVHAMNQSKLERELHLLDDMIETVRQTLSSVPDLVKSCPELQKLVEFLG